MAIYLLYNIYVFGWLYCVGKNPVVGYQKENINIII